MLSNYLDMRQLITLVMIHTKKLKVNLHLCYSVHQEDKISVKKVILNVICLKYMIYLKNIESFLKKKVYLLSWNYLIENYKI